MVGAMRTWRAVLAAVAVTGLAACATTARPAAPDPSYTLLTKPGTRAATDDLERAILKQLGQLTTSKEAAIGGRAVVAGAPYTAASGRTCRSVNVRAAGAAPARIHLACVISDAWSFVPDVVRRPDSAENTPSGGKR